MIQTKQLTKKYGEFTAIENVSLRVKQGEIYGFLGLNGAGKTTTIEALLGIIKPTEGECYLNGTKVHLKNNDIWHDVGYLVDAPYAYPELTVKENLHIFFKLRLLTNQKRIQQVIQQLNLTDYEHVRVKKLSYGNRIRLGIAKAILHEPKILILDEPVNGLDPAGIIDIRNLLQGLAKNDGVTILMSSHILEEVAKVCTTIGIIHEGKLLKEINKQRLEEELYEVLKIKTKDLQTSRKLLGKEGYETKLIDDQLVVTNKQAIKRPERVARLLIGHGQSLTELMVEKESLEKYFLRMIQKY